MSDERVRDQGSGTVEGVTGAVHVRRRGGWAHITFSQPGRHNCLSLAMWRHLETIARELRGDPDLRIVTMAGGGHDFTSGYDLSELVDMPLDQVNQAFQAMESAISAVEALPVPVVAVIEGWCLGGGFELALAADFRWAAPSARLGMPVAKLGIMLSPTFARRLVNVMGQAMARDLLFTCRVLSAQEAVRTGVVNGVLAEEDLESELAALAEQICGCFPRAIRQAKASVGHVIPSVQDSTAYFVDAEDFARAIRRFKRG